jgi:hypothetical protein
VCAETACEKARTDIATLRVEIMLKEMKPMIVVGVRVLFVGKKKCVEEP